jgi:hypothetical protein
MLSRFFLSMTKRIYYTAIFVRFFLREHGSSALVELEDKARVMSTDWPSWSTPNVAF